MKFLDLFAGIGGFRRGMELAGHECIGFCEFDKFATASYTSMHLITDEQREYLATLTKKQRQKEILKEKYRNGEWYCADIRDITGENIPKADCWCFGAPCFVAGTLVNTEKGLKPIEEVKIGDKVLTHKNRYQTVLDTMVHENRGIFKLKVQGSPMTECTGNHRFYVRDKSDTSNPYWKAVQDFDGNELVAVPNSDDTLWMPVKKIECDFDRVENVYNLEVENDNSYTANGLAAHNCQDFSVAGHRAGLEGDRSSLVREVFRILGEIQEEDRPEWLIYENVKGMLSSNRGFDFLAILLEMDELGYDFEWQLFNSKEYVPQNRERVYTIGHLRRCGSTKVFPIERADGADNIHRVDILGHRSNYRRNQQVYSRDGITETLSTCQGGGREHHTLEVIGKYGNRSFIDKNRVFSDKGISPAVTVSHVKDPIKTSIDIEKDHTIEIIGKAYERDNYGDNRNRIIGEGGAAPALTATQYKEPYRVGLPLSEILTPLGEE